MNTKSVEESRNAWELLRPEPVGLPDLVLVQPELTGLNVLEPIGTT